ncbi:hypothetical protein AYI70_g1181 [Smittium culicis]|uniref:Uncharacterized protein n=1 Tax=Smittium culicis TaxID=133412 RepID=A0A1R1YDM8_9FUNG|nr:hypothetical protein AYI70_g1181 [Smittium culicis]
MAECRKEEVELMREGLAGLLNPVNGGVTTAGSGDKEEGEDESVSVTDDSEPVFSRRAGLLCAAYQGGGLAECMIGPMEMGGTGIGFQ